MVVKRNKSIKKSYKNFRLRKGKSSRLNKKVRKNYKKSQSKSKSKYSRKNLRGLKNKSRRVRKSKKAIMRGGAERTERTVDYSREFLTPEEELEIKAAEFLADLAEIIFYDNHDPKSNVKGPFSHTRATKPGSDLNLTVDEFKSGIYKVEFKINDETDDTFDSFNPDTTNISDRDEPKTTAVNSSNTVIRTKQKNLEEIRRKEETYKFTCTCTQIATLTDKVSRLDWKYFTNKTSPYNYEGYGAVYEQYPQGKSIDLKINIDGKQETLSLMNHFAYFSGFNKYFIVPTYGKRENLDQEVKDVKGTLKERKDIVFYVFDCR